MGTAWMNGQFCDAKDLSLSARDIGILRGYGVFDFLRTYKGRPFHLRDHLIRLFNSASLLRLNIDYSLKELIGIVYDLLERNGFDESGIRLVCTGGESPSTMMPTEKNTLYILIEPLKINKEKQERQRREGEKLITFPHVRYKALVKANNYIPAIDALAEAKEKGALDALFIGSDGIITETTRANIFFREGDKWITPIEDILKGITRSVVMGLVPKAELSEETVHLDRLKDFSEAFICSTTKEILPIVKIDDIIIGTGCPGQETQELSRRLADYTNSPALWEKRQKEFPYGTL